MLHNKTNLMANYNLNSGYGQTKANALASVSGTPGKVFVVAKSTAACADILKSMYIPDPDGVNRYFATLATAIAATTASRGDVILLAPGHTETISSATALNLNVAGIKIVGLGVGSMRPTFTLDTANTSTITVSANSVSVENCIFIANFLNIATLFTVTTATDFRLLNCDIRDTSASLNFVGIVSLSTTLNAADGLTLDGNKITGLATTGAVYLLKPTGTNDRVLIQNNYYAQLSTNAAAIIPVSAGKILTNFILLNNRVNLQNAAGTATGYLITTDTAGTGFIDGNRFSALPTTPLLVTAGRGYVYGLNLHTDQADTSGYTLPIADL